MKVELETKDWLEISEQISKIKNKKNFDILKKISNSFLIEDYKNEARYILDLIGNQSLSFGSIKKEDFNFKYLHLENYDDMNLFLDKEEYFIKLKNILSNDKLLFKFRGIKIILEGRPGTGKTTLIKTLAKSIKKDLYSISAGKVISSKLGETQKNIDKMFEEINKCENSIILFDEFDSLIGSRDRNINDEYHRMIGTFNSSVDNLNKGLIFIAITNKKNFIDESTIRRFNIKIMMDEINIDKILLILENKVKEFNLKFNLKIVKSLFLIKIKDINYSLPEEIIINSLLNELTIEKSTFLLLNLKEKDLKDNGFTLREIELITGKSKSTLQRKINKELK